MQPPRAPLGQGTSVDRYTIEALIGRGGMGEVYSATDARLRRKVALKVLRAEDEDTNGDGVARLFREARAAASLSHPNAVSIHDLGENDGLFYIVMELVSGKPLLAYVGDDRVSMPRRLKWLTEIARALATAHRAGVIHRDVKPSNVMVTEDDVAKVLDFGLAKPMPRPNEPESFGFKTQAGRVLGTIRYMSPEQMIGTEADGRSDQYALGMTAYELIAGRYPPGKPFEIPALLDTLVADFPSDGARTVARMMKRLPDDRFPSMDDVVSAFEDLAAGRPVRALDLDAPTPKQPRPEDPSVVATVDEPKVGSTLQSATPEDFSADTQMAIEEALQPTMTAAELAKLKVGSAPTAAIPAPLPPSTPSTPPPAEAKKAAPAASTLMSPAQNDAVQKARTMAMAQDAKPQDAKPQDAKPQDARPQDAKPASRTIAMPSAPPKPPGTPSTLASADAGDKVAKVRAATSKMPVPVEIVEASPVASKKSEPPPQKSEPPPSRSDEGLPSTLDAARQVPAKRSQLMYVLVALALAMAAFGGWYFGQQSRSAKP